RASADRRQRWRRGCSIDRRRGDLRPRAGWSRGLGAPGHPAIDGFVTIGHAVHGEVLFHVAAAGSAIDRTDELHGVHELIDGVGDESRHPWHYDFWHRAAGTSHYRCPAGDRLDHGKAERLWPVDREQ